MLVVDTSCHQRPWAWSAPLRYVRRNIVIEASTTSIDVAVRRIGQHLQLAPQHQSRLAQIEELLRGKRRDPAPTAGRAASPRPANPP